MSSNVFSDNLTIHSPLHLFLSKNKEPRIQRGSFNTNTLPFTFVFFSPPHLFFYQSFGLGRTFPSNVRRSLNHRCSVCHREVCFALEHISHPVFLTIPLHSTSHPDSYSKVLLSRRLGECISKSKREKAGIHLPPNSSEKIKE